MPAVYEQPDLAQRRREWRRRAGGRGRAGIGALPAAPEELHATFRGLATLGIRRPLTTGP